MFPICATCGTQYGVPSAPLDCRICRDERQYVGWSGQHWTTLAELASDHTVRIEDDCGLPALGISPSFAIDQRALLLSTQQHRIMWECIALVTPEAVTAIQARGGVDVIAISHPHFYSAMVEWSEALGGVPILVHEADSQWICRDSPHIERWHGDAYQICPGVSLIRCGGHFPGSTALHWHDAMRPGGALFPGDALQVVFDRRHVTFMYSYPNYIPLHPDYVRILHQRLAPYEFADVFGFTWGRNILGDGRAAVDRSFERYLRAIGAAENNSVFSACGRPTE